jgi:rhamnosyltransferase
VESLFRQGFSIVIVDNHSKDPMALRSIPHKRLVELPENKGIAAALNEGMRISESMGAEWVLSLDQDTTFSETILQEYIKHIPHLDHPGAVSPRIIKRDEEDKGNPNKEVELIEKCPTSGFFMSVEAWKKAGQYDEWMFIDYVDYDMCMRLKINGYNIYRINNAFIIQELGKLKIHPLVHRIGDLMNCSTIKNFSITYNHSPFRNYYYVRNCLYYINKYSQFLDVRYEKKHLFKWELKKLVLEPDKIGNIIAILRGIKDYRQRIKRKDN